MDIGDPETTERAFRSDAYRQQIGWGARELQQALDAADGFDAKYGTDTTGADFVTPPGTYVPTLPRMFHHILQNIDVRFDEFTFVDLGSGKGRGLMLASEYPFRRIVGVELSPVHNETARKNLALYRERNPHQRCTNIEAVVGDATTFEYPNEDLFIWFFQSFGPEPITKFLAHLERLVAAHPRRIVLVHTQPADVEPFDKSPLFRRWGKQGGPSTIPFIVKDGVWPYAVFSNLDR